MAFNSFIGLFFSLGVIVLTWTLPVRLRNAFLLAASFLFYAYGDIFYSGLLALVIAIGYAAARIIAAGVRPRLVLTLSVAALLIILGVFKYYDFFTTSFETLLAQLGLRVDLVTLRILLPIGVSFYTFQTIGYLVDVYRGEAPAERNPVDYGLFIAFFPQLVAGPIERSKNLLRQVRTERAPPGREDINYGVFLIIQGYAKKIVIADTLAPFVDLLFGFDELSAPLIIVGVLLFAFQIYGDFSGYTDIARGYSRLLGFRILLNFDRPYFATSPSNFWRRWHISLSRWITDYVYIPLGGSRSRGPARRTANVVAAMGLSGLWHGAALNFVVWGVYHGFIIIAQRWVSAIGPLVRLNDRLWTAPGRILTFILVLYGWMYFRIEDFSRLLAYNRALVSDWTGGFEAAMVLGQASPFLAAALLIDLAEKYWLNVEGAQVERERGLAFYLSALLVFIAFLAAGDSGNFIYFRF